MRFLCVTCDAQMQLVETKQHRGSLSVLFTCPACGRETAMLTNPGETQLVTSLGIELKAGDAPKCPFSSALQQGPQPGENNTPSCLEWTAEAEERLSRVPDLVRPMAKMGIERFATEQGYREITVEVLDQAKSNFGL